MNSISFERLVFGSKGELLNPSALSIRVLWFEQRDRYLKFLAYKNQKNLKRVFNILDEASNVDSLRLDLNVEIPFAGDMFCKIRLGRNVNIGAEAFFQSHGGLSIRDGAIIGQKALVITLGHPLHPSQRHLHLIRSIDICSGVLVGCDTIVVNSGKAELVKIGEGSIVLPGTIVTKDIPPYSIVGGVNNILLQGKIFFRFIDNILAHEHLTL